jgi:hypothetical protein
MIDHDVDVTEGFRSKMRDLAEAIRFLSEKRKKERQARMNLIT